MLGNCKNNSKIMLKIQGTEGSLTSLVIYTFLYSIPIYQNKWSSATVTVS